MRHLATALSITAAPVAIHADIIASTDFTGRTVTGKTASNITWTLGGVQDPGDLTWVLEGGGPATTSLFDTADAQGHFAPDLNTGNEGPWSVTIPLILTSTEITIVDVDLDWQHFNNSGAFQGATRQVDWTVTVTGSTSGQVGTVTAVNISGTSGLETLTFTSPLTLTNAETWDVKILAAGTNTNGNNTGLDAITINGSIGPDIDPPLLVTLDPADDAPKVAIGTNLAATFNEPIAAGTGNITIKETVGDAIVEVFDVTSSPNLTFNAETVTIDPASNLDGDVGYYVEIDATAIEDEAGNSFAGIAGNTTWNFTTDGTAPMTAGFSNTGGGNVPVGAGLQVSFDEDVQIGSGNVVIRQLGDDAVLATIDVTTGLVVINGSSVTVFADTLLPANTEVYVEIDAGAFQDLAGNAFAGVSGSAIWTFTTGTTTNLLAHYRFDANDGGTTPDSIGTNFATLGDRVQINTNPGVPVAGEGALEMLGVGDSLGPEDGAVTSNSFAWPNDARTVTLWWKANTPNVDERDGTYVSFGASEDPPDGNGKRFDIKEQGFAGATLRVEVQGIGQNTVPAIDDGEWHFLAVVVPDNATFADIAWYVDGDPTNLNTSTNTLDIATGISPLAFGDSVLTFGDNTRVPSGFLDDVQVYGSVLSQSQLEFLYNNPGCVIGDDCGAPLALDISTDGSTLDFQWPSQSGKQYDLLSSTDPATETDPSNWALYFDGVTTHHDIAASGTGTNTLNSIPLVDGVRFFALREEDVPPLLSENFDTNNGGFTDADKGSGSIWAYGVPSAADQGGGEILTDNSGTGSCWGVNLAGPYAAGTDACLRSPVINLTNVTGASLSFALAIDADTGHTYEVNVIEAATDTVIANVIPPTEDGNTSTSDWSNIGPTALPALAFGQSVRLEWRFKAATIVNPYNGAYIDDVVLTSD